MIKIAQESVIDETISGACVRQAVNRNAKDRKAAIPAPRDQSNILAMAYNSPTKTSHALTASYPSASAHSQLSLQTDDTLRITDLKEQSLHDSKDRSVEHPTPTANLSMDRRHQDKSHQHPVAEQRMNNAATAYSRPQEQQVGNSHAQLGLDPRMRELEDLKRMEFDLREKERQLNDFQIQYKEDLATKEEQISSLEELVQTIRTKQEQELKELTHGFEADIIQKNREVADIRSMWKQVAKDLGKYKAQDTVVDQVTDSELTQKATQIKYNVRNLAYQHFGGELNSGRNLQGACQNLQSQLQVPPEFLKACINSPVKRPMLVGAVLWDFLVKDIFETFWWGGSRGHRGMENLTEILESRIPHITFLR